MKLRKINSIALVLRPRQQKAKDLAQKIIAWFKAKGINAWTTTQNEYGEPTWTCNDPDLVLVLGGDGTMLGALRAVVGTSIPVLGVNLGRVGFLTGIAEKTWQKDLEEVLVWGLELRKCMVLAWQIERCGKIIEKGQAINDVVLRGGNLAKLVNLNVHIGLENVGMLRADGLIIATPTGSSSYAFSAGGPIVYPEVDAFVVAPVCPFLNRMPPFIVNSQKNISVDIAPDNSAIYLTSDGQEGIALEPGDKVFISKDESYSYMGLLSQDSYYAVLRDRGFIREP